MPSERMSPVDTAWLHMDDPGSPADIVTLLTLDERLSFDELTIRASIPVNLRPIHWIEEMDDSMGNRFGLVFLDLPTNEKTTESRFRGLKQKMDAMKGTPEAFVAFGILNALGDTRSTVEHIVNEVFGRKVSLVGTNVPGPREPLYIDGNRLRDVML